jgi:hypothetical protein
VQKVHWYLLASVVCCEPIGLQVPCCRFLRLRAYAEADVARESSELVETLEGALYPAPKLKVESSHRILSVLSKSGMVSISGYWP